MGDTHPLYPIAAAAWSRLYPGPILNHPEGGVLALEGLLVLVSSLVSARCDAAPARPHPVIRPGPALLLPPWSAERAKVLEAEPEGPRVGERSGPAQRGARTP